MSEAIRQLSEKQTNGPICISTETNSDKLMWSNIDVELRNILPLRVPRQCADVLLVGTSQSLNEVHP